VSDEPWRDDVADAVALAQAVREDRTGDVAVILRHCNPFATALTLAKLLAEAVSEAGASEEWFRTWSARAIGRP